MFNWDDLRIFTEVARTRSLSAAARKLGVNHTTIARRVQALEGALKTRLFEKTPTGYLTTPAGTRLVDLAEQMEAISMSATELVAEQDTVLTGTVRVGVPEGFGTQFLGTRADQFYLRNPGIDLEIVAGTQFLSISKREADLAITLSRPRVGRLVARKLTDYTLRLYGSQTYLEQRPEIKHVDDLKDHTLIGYIDDLIYAPQLRYLDEILPKARVKLRSSSINAQLAAVESGLGLCVLPSFMAAAKKNLHAVLPREIEIARTFWLSMHQDLRHVRRVAAVWDWLVDIVAKEQPLLCGAG